MPPPRKVARISFREQMLRNQASMNLYADLADKPRVEIRGIPPAPKPRGPSTSTVPLERDVLKAIVRGLLNHPKIGLVERVNSGSSLEQNADGTKRYTSFHVVYPVAGVRFAAVDISATLLGSGRRFVVEVKRPGWREPKTEREFKQWGYIKRVIACGGAGMFATSWAEVEDALAAIA